MTGVFRRSLAVFLAIVLTAPAAAQMRPLVAPMELPPMTMTAVPAATLSAPSLGAPGMVFSLTPALPALPRLVAQLRLADDPAPERKPSRLKRWHKAVIATALALAVGFGAYELLSPRLRPLPPPPVDVITQSPYKMVPDPAASIATQPQAADPALALRLMAHRDAVESVTVSADGKSLVTVSRDGAWRAWNLATGQTFEPTDYPGKARGALFADGGSKLILVNDDGEVRVLDLKTNEVSVIGQDAGQIALHAISPDGQRVAVTGKDGKVAVLEIQARVSAAFQAEGKVLLMKTTPQGTMLLTAKRGIHRLIKIAPGGQPVIAAERYIPGARVLSAAASRDGARIAAAADMAGDQGMVLWDIASNDVKILSAADFGLETIAIASVALDADGGRAAVLAEDGTLWVWRPAAGGPARTGKAPAGAAVHFGEDGRLYVSEPGGTLWVWNTEAPK